MSTTAQATSTTQKATLGILIAISLSHFLNDLMQSVIPAIYPILKDEFALTFGQVGLIQLAYQMTASLLQPAVGMYTDKHPHPFSLVLGMGFTFCGLIMVSLASSYPILLLSVACVGIGSSVFHPEASRVARMASGGRHGLAQSLFQVGGNAGSAMGPLLAAIILLSKGQHDIAWFALFALVGMLLLSRIGLWYRNQQRKPKAKVTITSYTYPKPVVIRAITVLIILMFSKFFYMASMTSYYTFYLIDTFHVSIKEAQVFLFIFLAAIAVGTVIGGPLGDKVGRKRILWFSILGALPFTLLLPHMNLTGTCILSVFIGLILASAFPSMVVYAQELVPGKVGTIAGMFFGLSFGLGGVGSAVLGHLADVTSISYVYNLCAFLPLLGCLIIFLPNKPPHIEIKENH